jgi:histidine triad (HIT) family protein
MGFVPLDMPTAEPCPLCDELAGRLPYTVLRRGAHASMLITREQRGLAHILVITTVHRPSILDLHDDEQGPLMLAVHDAAAAISAAYDPAGIAVWQNNGRPAHQTVPHLHVHVAGTYPDRGTDWGPVPKRSVADTDKIAEVLKPYLTG